MRKVKPAFEEDKHAGFEHVTGCFKYFSIFGTGLVFWNGIFPIKVGGKAEIFEFKLISVSSLLAFVRLFIFTFPFLVLPLIFIFGGFCNKELEDVRGESFVNVPPIVGLNQLYQAEYCMNFLIYVLPFAFAFVAVEPLNRWHYRKIEFQKMSNRKTFLKLRLPLFVSRQLIGA